VNHKSARLGIHKLIGPEPSLLDLPSPFSFPPKLHAAGIKEFEINQSLAETNTMLEHIGGQYIYAYCGRDEGTGESLIIFERLNLSPTGNKGALNVSQNENVVIEMSSEGTARLISGVLEIDIIYESKYPKSRLLLKPLYVDTKIQIMSGIYTDVSIQVDLQIFSTVCHLFKVVNHDLYPRKLRSSDGSGEYDLWEKSFELDSFINGRLLGNAGHSSYNFIRNAVIETRKREGQ